MGSRHRPESPYTQRISISEWERGSKTSPHRTPLPKTQLHSHLPAGTGCRCLTHWGTLCLRGRAAASGMSQRLAPRLEEPQRDRSPRTHAVLQRDVGAYPDVIDGNFSGTSFPYNALEHNLEARRTEARLTELPGPNSARIPGFLLLVQIKCIFEGIQIRITR